MPETRLLKSEDVPMIRALAAQSRWNQTQRDIEYLMEAAPDGCFGIDADGGLAATATALVTPQGIGWIGMVLTLEQFRGRGYATQLVKECIAYLQPLVATIKLDATKQGEPLYRRLGFVDEAPIQRWMREPGPLPETAAATGSYTGTKYHPRIPLDDLVETREAFAAGRCGTFCFYLGPCYAASETAAHTAIRAMLARHSQEPVYCDLLPGRPAERIASELGFEPVRTLTRMYLGEPRPTPEDVYAIAGFEWGD